MYCFASGDAAYLVDTRRARRTDAAFAQHAAPFLSRLLPCRTPAHIAAEQVGEFCRMALPILRDYTDLTAPAALDTVAPEPSFAMAIGVDDGLVTCKITVTYGDWSADLFSLGAPGSPFEEQRPGVPPRDEVAEFRVMDTAALYFDFYERGLAFEERDDARLFCLLTEGLSACPNWVRSCSATVCARSRSAPRPSSRFVRPLRAICSMSSWARAGFRPRTLPSISIRTSAIKRLRALRPATSFAWTRGRAPRLALPRTWVSMPSTCSTACRFPRRAPCSSTACSHARRRSSRSRRCVPPYRRAPGHARQDGLTVPASLKATMRGYQVDGYQWLGSLEHLGLGGILADDMGLGKTLQMIAHILARVEAGDTKPTLVVCPASLVYNWTAELERFAPSLDVCAIVGAKAQRRVQIAGVAEHSVVVTSYDLCGAISTSTSSGILPAWCSMRHSTLKIRSRRWRAPPSACLPACALP